MLSQKNRLKKEKDFEAVFKQGRSFKQGQLVLRARNNKLKSSRFGFVVNKKFSKKAVERNKIKRRLREIIKTRISKIKKPSDAIIIVMPKMNNDFQELEKTIDKLFKKWLSFY